jgi:hypothetical protein
MQEPAPSRARLTRMGDVSVEYQERKAARRFVRDAIGVGLGLYYRQVEELPLRDRFAALLRRLDDHTGPDRAVSRPSHSEDTN